MINPAQIFGVTAPPGTVVRRSCYSVDVGNVPGLLLVYRPSRVQAVIDSTGGALAGVILGTKGQVQLGEGSKVDSVPVLVLRGADELWARGVGFLGAQRVGVIDEYYE